MVQNTKVTMQVRNVKLEYAFTNLKRKFARGK